MKISIITATKNNKAGLLRAIESVRSQTYKNVEHIIVDGGSTDGTVEILKKNSERDWQDDILRQAQDDILHFDKLSASSAQDYNYEIRVISEADSGIYDAINKGIKLATGDVIGLLHSDDFYKDEFVLERYAKVFSQRSEIEPHKDSHYHLQTTNHQTLTIDAVYSDLVYVTKKSNDQKIALNLSKDQKSENEYIDSLALNTEYSVIRTWKTHKKVNSELLKLDIDTIAYYSPLTINHLLNGWMPPHPTLFLRASVFNKFGLYNTNFRIAGDYEMILRLFFMNKIDAVYIPEVTYCMTLGGTSNRSLKNILKKSKEDLSALRSCNIPFPFIALLKKNFRKIPQFFQK